MQVYAIGDIHGCISQFQELLDKISLTKKDKLILLGDYIDRGPDSKAVLDKIAELINKGYRIIPLLGNHEIMMLKTFDNPAMYGSWLVNGGSSTMQSLNCSVPGKIPRKYISLLKNMPYYHVHDKVYFVHAGFNDSLVDPFLDKESMLWIRKEEYKPVFIKKKTIIHGHTPVPLPKLQKLLNSNPNVINLDTGCVYTERPDLGHLSAYCLNNSKLYTAQNTNN